MKEKKIKMFKFAIIFIILSVISLGILIYPNFMVKSNENIIAWHKFAITWHNRLTFL